MLASFVAPWMMGSLIHHNAGSFWEAFLAFAIVEVLVLGLIAALTHKARPHGARSVPGN